MPSVEPALSPTQLTPTPLSFSSIELLSTFNSIPSLEPITPCDKSLSDGCNNVPMSSASLDTITKPIESIVSSVPKNSHQKGYKWVFLRAKLGIFKFKVFTIHSVHILPEPRSFKDV